MRDKLDAETIAKGLSEAQRDAIRRLRPDGRLGVPRGYGKRYANILRALPGIVDQQWAGDANRYFLNDLGLAVRAILKGE